MSVRSYDALLPKIEPGTVIPRLIHQTYPSNDLPELLRENVEQIRLLNPDWDYHLYTDSDVEAFILQEYGEGVLSYYLRIDKVYGAARADLFRYLLVYKRGGVYLDIKSRFLKPIDEVLRGDEQFVISRWSNGKNEKYEGYGLHSEMLNYPGGEIQQWHIIAARGHIFLRAVILSVFKLIDAYTPWRTGVGRMGVLRLTGPIAYTIAITPLLSEKLCRTVNNEQDLCLQYSVLPKEDHQILFKKHYTTIQSAIVKPQGSAVLSVACYNVARKVRNIQKRIFATFRFSLVRVSTRSLTSD